MFLEAKSTVQLPFEQVVGSWLSFTLLSVCKFVYSVCSGIYFLELSETPKLKQKKVEAAQTFADTGLLLPSTVAGEQFAIASLIHTMITGEHYSGAAPTRVLLPLTVRVERKVKQGLDFEHHCGVESP